LKDAWIDYYVKGEPLIAPTLSLGQMKWPFGYEVVQSSSVRETPERATWSRRLFPDERDRGFKIAGPTGKSLLWEVGLFNGTGINTNDNNHEKDVVGRLRKSFGPRLDVGVSGYSGKSFRPASGSGATAVPAREFVKTRYGADFQYYLAGAAIKGEYVTARDLGRDPRGWLAQLNYNVGTKNILVAKYDEFDDDNPTSTNGKLKAWNLGLIRYLDHSTRLKLFYQINDEARNETDNDGFTVELIALF
jgi:phosphate-selective porin